jgi:hypothetical protein
MHAILTFTMPPGALRKLAPGLDLDTWYARQAVRRIFRQYEVWVNSDGEKLARFDAPWVSQDDLGRALPGVRVWRARDT